MNPNPSSETRPSVAAAMRLVGDRWTLLLIHDMTLGVRRFEDLRARSGIPPSTLALRLRTFEARGIVERVRYEHRPPRDEYRLTEMGRDLWKVIAALHEWSDRWAVGASTAETTYRESGGVRPAARGSRVDPAPGEG